MKTKLTLCITLLVSLIVTSCRDKNAPEEVVKNYYTHLLKGEYEDAKKYLTEDHQSFCDLLITVTPEEERTKLAKTDVSIRNITCDIKDDTTAICSCEIKTKLEGDEKSIKEPVKLKKIDGTWYVNQGKESLMGDEEVVRDVPQPTSEEEILTVDTLESEENVKKIE
jgi:hypothetical protein